MRGVKWLTGLVLIIVGVWAFSMALMWAYEAFTEPLSVESERVQQVSPLIDICREVEAGSLDARTENGCE